MRAETEDGKPRGWLATPSAWVARFAPLVAARAPVLDLACGGGRHTRLFLEAGHTVTAVDRDVSGLAELRDRPGLEIVEADLESERPWPFPGRQFGAIVVANYLYRPLFPVLFAALAPDGVLIYETFAEGNEAFGRPRNPDHLLKTGELLDLVHGRLLVVAYEHGKSDRCKPAMVQRICAVNAAPDSHPAIEIPRG